MAITKTGKALIIGGAVWTAISLVTLLTRHDVVAEFKADPFIAIGGLIATFIGLAAVGLGFTLKKKTPQTQTQ